MKSSADSTWLERFLRAHDLSCRLSSCTRMWLWRALNAVFLVWQAILRVKLDEPSCAVDAVSRPLGFEFIIIHFLCCSI
eukprot:2668900-Pleurochrysis_carterae.AAC.1